LTFFVVALFAFVVA